MTANEERHEGLLSDIELIRQLAQLEARVEAARETLEHERRWQQGEVQSLSNNIRANAAELARIDTMLRGVNGDNGLASRVHALEAYRKAEEDKTRRWDARTWGIAMALFASVLSLAMRFL